MAIGTPRIVSDWIERLYEAKSIANGVYSEVNAAGISDLDVDHLASLICEIDEAIAEVEAFES